MSEEKIVYPEFSTSKTEKPEAVKYSEDAQAKVFVDIQNGDLKYVEENDRWYHYNGFYWEELSRLAVFEAARLMNRDTALTIEKEAKLKKQISSRRFTQQVEAFARHDERCLLAMEELDADPWLLGTPEGIIDLRTGRPIDAGLRPYVTMTTAVAPADVADKTTCPLFLEFMDEFTWGDNKLKKYLLGYSGYSLTGIMSEQCLLFLYGDGNNGKTVFIQLLRWLFGAYAITAAIELFVTTGIGKHLTGFAALHRKRLVIANETQKGHTLRMDVIKAITGQDPIRANFMRQDTFEFLPVGKLMMFGNHKPSLPNAGKAERKRIRMIPCNMELAANELDRDLLSKLMAEGPGILRALIDGCRDWQEHGLVTPDCVEEHTENYFYTQDSFNKWVEACCDIGPNEKDASTVLWKSWQIWSKQNNVETGTETAFSESLEQAGFRYDKNLKFEDGSRRRGWHGLAKGVDQEELARAGQEKQGREQQDLENW
jgi:putative DNA primase/helicase